MFLGFRSQCITDFQVVIIKTNLESSWILFQQRVLFETFTITNIPNFSRSEHVRCEDLCIEPPDTGKMGSPGGIALALVLSHYAIKLFGQVHRLSEGQLHRMVADNHKRGPFYYNGGTLFLHDNVCSIQNQMSSIM